MYLLASLLCLTMWGRGFTNHDRPALTSMQAVSSTSVVGEMEGVRSSSGQMRLAQVEETLLPPPPDMAPCKHKVTSPQAPSGWQVVKLKSNFPFTRFFKKTGIPHNTKEVCCLEPWLLPGNYTYIITGGRNQVILTRQCLSCVAVDCRQSSKFTCLCTFVSSTVMGVDGTDVVSSHYNPWTAPGLGTRLHNDVMKYHSTGSQFIRMVLTKGGSSTNAPSPGRNSVLSLSGQMMSPLLTSRQEWAGLVTLDLVMVEMGRRGGPVVCVDNLDTPRELVHMQEWNEGHCTMYVHV